MNGKLKWATDLGEYYATQKTTPPARIRMVLEVFAREPEAVMNLAVHKYMKTSDWFPTVSGLMPHVTAARDIVNSGPFKRLTVAELTIEQRARLDDKLLAIEIRIGDIRPLDEIESEIARHASILARRLKTDPLIPGANQTPYVATRVPLSKPLMAEGVNNGH